MKKLVIAFVLVLTTLAPAVSSAVSQAGALSPESTAVTSFRLFSSFQRWQAVDRDTFILWVSPRQPYLIDLRGAGPGLRHAFSIGVTSSFGRVSASFDSVIADGWRYPIKSIHRIDPEYAKELRLRLNKKSIRGSVPD